MSRPFKCRRIFCNTDYTYFKPIGVPLRNLIEIILTVDELEAIRLADKERLYHEDAAKRMNISRQTFGNILNSAHKKIAVFLLEGRALKIKGGYIEMMQRHFLCDDCKNEWSSPHGTERPDKCPKCHSTNIHRSPNDRDQPELQRGQGQGRCMRKNR